MYIFQRGVEMVEVLITGCSEKLGHVNQPAGVPHLSFKSIGKTVQDVRY
jgi:hypothetical protein